MKKVKQTLNEEQEAQAIKEAGGATTMFRCWIPGSDQWLLYVQAEKWFDARAFAIKELGVADVKCEKAADFEDPGSWWEIHHVGTMATGTSNPLRLQKRFFKRDGNGQLVKTTWQDA